MRPIDGTQAEACATQDGHTPQRDSTQQAYIVEQIYHALGRYPDYVRAELVLRREDISGQARSAIANTMTAYPFARKYAFGCASNSMASGTSAVIAASRK